MTMITVPSEMILSQTSETATIDAPIEAIDIAAWLINPISINPLSINVEMIGTGLVVQHYVAEIAEATHCHLISTSDVLTPHGWTTLQFVWDLRAEPIDERVCRFRNTVTSRPTAEFLQFLTAHGQTFEDAAAARQAVSGHHNRRETPLFAAGITRKAQVGARARQPA